MADSVVPVSPHRCGGRPKRPTQEDEMASFTTFLRKTAASVMLMALPAAPAFAQDWGDHEGHRIRHVFVIVLENEGYDVTFGPASKAPYLSQTLVSQGALLSQYYGTGHVS